MSNMVMVLVAGRKRVVIRVNQRVRITDSTDISTKKIISGSIGENPFISVVSVGKSAGITDIAVKKKIKHLTFIFGCAKRMW
jgi:hypothetical protein